MTKRREPARLTEQTNPASASLDRKSSRAILRIINREDRKVPAAVAKVIPAIARAVDLAVRALSAGGRLVYLGAGTSGRLGVLDAAECGPTFGTDQVLAVMAGGRGAMFRPAEAAEDDRQLAARDLRRVKFARRDILVGISASGRTPYTLGGLRYARGRGASTVAVTSNAGSPMERLADVTIAPVTGGEVIAGSTRMKAGTAQKLVLNMLSTATMARLGRVFSNWMVNVRLNNEKLRQRGLGIVMATTGAAPERAAPALRQARGNLPVAILMLLENVSRAEAERRLRGKSPAAVIRHAARSRERHGSIHY